jgi:membrane-bound metal-dependent hydrolase YbcI (DUF457 family)
MRYLLREALRRLSGKGGQPVFVLDFVTYEGVPWFWPLDEKYSLDLGPAGGLLVGFLGFLALVLSVYLLADRFLVVIVLLPKIG